MSCMFEQIIQWQKKNYENKIFAFQNHCYKKRINDSFDEKGIIKMTSDKENYENNAMTFQGYKSWSKRTFFAKFSPGIL